MTTLAIPRIQIATKRVRARVAKAMVGATKRVRERATTWAMPTATRMTGEQWQQQFG
jgi:hypothetical protein